MNTTRRKSLNLLADQLWSAKNDLIPLLREEEAFRDRTPEALRGSARYRWECDTCHALDSALSGLEEAIVNIEAALE